MSKNTIVYYTLHRPLFTLKFSDKWFEDEKQD